MYNGFGNAYFPNFNGYASPYQARLEAMQQNQGPAPQFQADGQRADIITVNGENGARAYRMPPNSRALLLDENAPILWLAQTDGAGYKTISAYKITPYVEEAPIDTKTLEQRISRLEAILNEKPDSFRSNATATPTATAGTEQSHADAPEVHRIS